MARPLVYLDECMHVGLTGRLRLRGFAVTTAQDQAMISASDAEQLAYATKHGAMIVTYNVRHFRSLNIRMRPHGGIVTLPDSPLDWQEIRAAMLLDWAATLPDSDYRSQLFRWHDLQQRLIAGMRLPDYSEEDVRLSLGQIP